MKLYVALKDFIQGLKNFERGIELRLTEAEAKYHVLAGRVKAVEAHVATDLKALVAEVAAVEAKISNTVTEVKAVGGKLSNAVAKSTVATANTANVSTTANGSDA